MKYVLCDVFKKKRCKRTESENNMEFEVVKLR